MAAESLPTAPSLPAREQPWPRWPLWFGFLRDRPGATPSWRRRLTFTRLGRWYCGLTVGIGFAAINTGNNLLFLVLGVLLSSIIVSGLLSENALREVRVRRVLPLDAAAGRPALIGLSAVNEKKRAPSFSLELREANGEVAGATFLLALAPGAREETAYRFTPTRRGRHRFVQLEVATRSPFGLFEKARPIDAPGELIVFPRPVEPPVQVPRSSGSEGERPQARVGVGQEVHGLRDHRPGEDARAIHWRSSARAGKLLAVEREEERRRRVCIVCDARGATGDRLERMIEQAAALFTRALDEGSEAALALPGVLLPPSSGGAHLRAGLTALALFESAPEQRAPEPPPGLSIVAVERAAMSATAPLRSSPCCRPSGSRAR